MRTTIDIADALLREAKRVAAREGTTVRELVESGLRYSLEQRRKRRGFKLKLVTVSGGGLQPGVPSELPRGLAYDLSVLGEEGE